MICNRATLPPSKRNSTLNAYKHLAAEERYHIYGLRKAGRNLSEIANELGVHKSTISREIKRNSGLKGYRPKQAQVLSEARHACSAKNSGRFKPEDLALVDALLAQDYSPEQVSGRLGLEGVLKISHETIYKRIYEDKASGGSLHKHLRSQKKRRKRYASGASRRGVMPGRVGIEHRPAIVDAKTRIGDWEGDTVIGKSHKGAIVTLAERKSRFLLAGHVPAKDANLVGQMVIGLLAPFESKVMTITFDNGREFTRHAAIAEGLGAEVYFARPYHSWERGLNENCNGLLRQYFPKGMELGSVDSAELIDALCRLNHRPKKVLGYRTPFEVFFGESIRYAERVKVALQT